MKTINEVHHYRLHKYSWTGYTLGCTLLLISLVNMFVLKKALYHPLAGYITLVPGIALILRAHRPPIGVIRGVSLICGGIIAGALPMLITLNDSWGLWTSLIGGIMGATLLGLGFSPVYKADN